MASALGSVIVVVHDGEHRNELDFRKQQKVRNFFWTAFYEAEASHGVVGIVVKIRQKAFV
eukprot:1870889-Pleurochrysis_carterae.AAC.1